MAWAHRSSLFDMLLIITLNRFFLLLIYGVIVIFLIYLYQLWVSSVCQSLFPIYLFQPSFAFLSAIFAPLYVTMITVRMIFAMHQLDAIKERSSLLELSMMTSKET